MKTRQKENNMAISVRMNKAEWEEVKSDGDATFKTRSVGYMHVLPGEINFKMISPFYKDMKELDEANKEKSDEQVIKDQEVKNAIAQKVL